MDSTDLFREILHLLGDMLGEVICEQHGKKTFDTIELIRSQSKNLRDNYNTANFETVYSQLDSQIESLYGKPETVQEVSRAFAIYLLLNNVAETVYQTINLKKQVNETTKAISNSITQLLKRYPTTDKLEVYLKDLEVMIVLTQHPTEVRRRTILHKEKEIFSLLLEYFLRGRKSRALIKRQLKEELETLWLTAEVRDFRPSVKDEIQAAAAFPNYSLFQAIKELYDDIWEEFRQQLSGKPPAFVPIFKLGSWVGGDRDGNPYVTVETTRFALAYNRRIVLKHYIDELEKLFHHCSVSLRRRTKLLPELKDELISRLHTDYNLPERTKANINEPYRQWIQTCQQRLEASLLEHHGPHPFYAKASDFKQDLLLLQRALEYINAKSLAHGMLANLLRELDVFGFHLSTLDIRQHSKVFERLIHEVYNLIGITNQYSTLKSHQKIELILESLESPRITFFTEDLTSESQELWKLFLLMRECIITYGEDSFGSIIISMAEDESDILEVLTLQWWSGLFDPHKKRSPCPIVPLFETIPSLQAAPQIMESLWSIPCYLALLKQLNLRQEVMIGYSDSAKDGGYLASQWNIYLVQERLVALSEQHGIKIYFFHGKGGAVGRGGGEIRTAINGLPNKAAQYGLKITEQGEVIAQKYLLKEISYANLLQLLLGVFDVESERFSPTQADREIMESLVAESRNFYRDLVYNTKNFVKYFEQASPIEFISELNIGSRPAKRRATKQIDDLRAIPWIFAWTQNRTLLPVWYGVGTGFSKYKDHLRIFQNWCNNWVFFIALIDNLSVQLLKTDMIAARQYSRLSRNHYSLFNRIFDEYFNTRRIVREIIDQPRLRVRNPLTQKSIEARTPYLDPLTLIQIHSIQRYRDNNPEEINTILVTINGIAAGMKNTG